MCSLLVRRATRINNPRVGLIRFALFFEALYFFIKQLPNVAEFSVEELEKRSGKAAQLLDIAQEISSMSRYDPRKIDKLRLLRLTGS